MYVHMPRQKTAHITLPLTTCDDAIAAVHRLKGLSTLLGCAARNYESLTPEALQETAEALHEQAERLHHLLQSAQPRS